MKNLLLNQTTKNFILTNYNFTFTPDQVTWMAQKLRIRISMFLGGWYLNTTIGLPYLPLPGQPQVQAILGSKNPNQAQAISLLKALIIATPGIIGLQQFAVAIVKNPNGPPGSSIFQGSFTAQMQGGQVVTLELPGS
jgi:hypothetical protein